MTDRMKGVHLAIFPSKSPIVWVDSKKTDWEYIQEYMDDAHEHNNLKLLKAILNEALPNWRDVYDRLIRTEGTIESDGSSAKDEFIYPPLRYPRPPCARAVDSAHPSVDVESK